MVNKFDVFNPTLLKKKNESGTTFLKSFALFHWSGFCIHGFVLTTNTMFFSFSSYLMFTLAFGKKDTLYNKIQIKKSFVEKELCEHSDRWTQHLATFKATFKRCVINFENKVF